MTQNWKEIWGRRSGGVGGGLESLINLNGFDSGAGRIETEDYRTYATIISNKLGVYTGASVFEVGCGAGAFLYALTQKMDLSVGGIDYGSGLIEAARRAMPDGDFEVLEANTLEIALQYDYVFTNSVFQYFDLPYAEEVLSRMIKKTKIAAAVLDVPDLQTKTESEAMRRDALTREEYEKKYAGLAHTYYDREWFREQAEKHGCDFELFDGCVPNYAQNRFRFGCIIRR